MPLGLLQARHERRAQQRAARFLLRTISAGSAETAGEGAERRGAMATSPSPCPLARRAGDADPTSARLRRVTFGPPAAKQQSVGLLSACGPRPGQAAGYLPPAAAPASPASLPVSLVVQTSVRSLDPRQPHPPRCTPGYTQNPSKCGNTGAAAGPLFHIRSNPARPGPAEGAPDLPPTFAPPPQSRARFDAVPHLCPTCAAPSGLSLAFSSPRSPRPRAALSRASPLHLFPVSPPSLPLPLVSSAHRQQRAAAMPPRLTPPSTPSPSSRPRTRMTS